MKDKYIWLIGENNGNTMNNNSYYFWKHVVLKDDMILKYYVAKKNKTNKKIYNELTLEEKKYFVWKNSIKHYKCYKNSDMFFVSQSYKDIQPSKGGGAINAPVIYLQHGITGIKKLGYKGNSYNNHLFRFVYYNTEMYEKFQTENNMKSYQLLYGKYFPRYKEFARKQRDLSEEQNQILWFATWREYFGKNNETKNFLRIVKRTLQNKELVEFLKKNNLKIKFCMHSLFSEEHKKYLKENLKDVIEVIDASKIDLMDEMVKSKLLITDYSSVGFDFTFLNKPVVLFQPDRESYLKCRELYCDYNELEEYKFEKSKQLIKYIISNNYEINNFFKKRLPDKINYDEIIEGKFIDDMYETLKQSQINKVVFLGYNFFGRGGTISATKALAEGLLEKGYCVEFLSLKKTARINSVDFPYGCTVKSLYYASRKSKSAIIKRLIFFSKRHYSYFKMDSNKNYLIPYVGYGLKKYLKNVKANAVVSTRETMHLFLKDAKNKNIKNKIYFYHTDGNLIEGIYPGLMDKLKQIKLEKCAFVTELNRQKYIDKLGYSNYSKYAVVGNSITSNSMITKDEIHSVAKKDVYTGIYLTRISKDRVNDLNNAINFAKYLKENKIKNIKIDVFGTGDYVDIFEDIIYDNDLDDYIEYMGLTTNPSEELIKHDFAVDFSLNQSFGMSYIEGILNGLTTFAYENYGSKEVLKEFPELFIKSNEDLVNKINNISNVSKKELCNRYDVIMNKYSREAVADRFIKFIGE